MLDRLAQLRSGREGLCKRAAPTLEIIVTSLRGIQRSKRRRVLNEISIRDLKRQLRKGCAGFVTSFHIEIHLPWMRGC